MKFPGVISLRNALPTCAIPNGGLRRASCATFLKLMKIPCAVSGTQEHGDAGLLDGADTRLEHQVELARLGEIAIAGLTRSLAGTLAAAELVVLTVGEMVGPKPELAVTAVDEGIREPGHVPGRLPHAGMEDHGRVERDDVLPLAHHRVEPQALHVLLEQDAVVTVVVRRAEPAVDLRRREDEAAPAAE